MKKTTLNRFKHITQQTTRKHLERNSKCSVCTLYDSLCLFVFLPFMSSATFSLYPSLSPSLCLCEYSEELHSIFEQE